MAVAVIFISIVLAGQFGSFIQPIAIMASLPLAMIFGMLPMDIALNEGGEIQAPMGQAIIGGVITSTPPLRANASG